MAEVATAADLSLFLEPGFAARAAAAVQNGEFPAEALEHDLGRVFLLAGLIRVLAGLQLAFDVDLRALLQELLGDSRQVFVEDHHVVPLGALLALAGGLVLPGFRGGDSEIHYGVAGVEPPHLRVLAEVADQDDLVHASRHGSLSTSRPARCKRPWAPVTGLGLPLHTPVPRYREFSTAWDIVICSIYVLRKNQGSAPRNPRRNRHAGRRVIGAPPPRSSGRARTASGRPRPGRRSPRPWRP